MLWFARIAEKFDLPASLLYKHANPETMRQLRELKDKVRKQRHQLNFRITPTPKIRELINAPINPPEPPPAPEMKVASVSFFIADSHKIAQPKDLMKLSWLMLTWADKNIPHDIYKSKMFSVMPDGDDSFKYEGTINWYYANNLNRLLPYIKMFIATELEPMGVQANIREVNESQLNGSQTIRIEITANATQNIEPLPEMNISTSNFTQLNKLLQISPPDDFTGSIEAQDLLARISMARSQVSQYTRPPEESGGKGTGQAHWIDYGVDEGRLNQYLSMLEQMAQYAKNMNKAIISWG